MSIAKILALVYNNHIILQWTRLKGQGQCLGPLYLRLVLSWEI